MKIGAPTRAELALQGQAESRKQLTDFLARVTKPVQRLAKSVKSEWFGRPDKELKDWIDRGRAIAEIQDTLGYRLIMEQTRKEITWAQEQLEIGKLNDDQLRAYLKALRFVKDFILTTERNADISSKVLAGRAREIERDSFVRSATNDRSGNN